MKYLKMYENMEYIKKFEGFKNYLIGGALLTSLLTNNVYGKGKQDKQKAEMSIIDSINLQSVYTDLLSRGYEVLDGNIKDMKGNTFIFTSSSNQDRDWYIKKSQDDLESKLSILKKEKINQIIFTKNTSGTYSSVVITEVK